MCKLLNDIPKKKRGRPATGKGEGILVRGHDDFLRPLDAWIARQKPRPSRPEAIRRLVEIGLAAPRPSDRTLRPARSLNLGAMAQKEPAQTAKTERLARARELASEAIDEMGDPTAHADERDERRRRLTKGPPEFREHRVDLPKTKG
jgi:hypothetical protein